MSETLTHRRAPEPARDQAHILFAQTMRYGAATAALFVLGAYLGHSLPGNVSIAAFAALIGMQFAARRSQQVTVALLGAFGLLTGLAPVLAAHASMDLQAPWQAGGATALFIAAFGAAGYAIRRDPTVAARVSFWAVALIAFGIVVIFVSIDVLNVFLVFLQIFSREQ